MKTKRTLLVVLFAVLLLFVACGPKESEASRSEEVSSTPAQEISAETVVPKVDVIRQAGRNVGVPNPFRHTARGPGMARMRLLYDSLLDKDETGMIPWLAKRWDISDDGMTYTFHLQEDAVWHDGTPLTAEDVAFTFSYYREHAPVSNSLLSEGTYLVAETEIFDPHTIAVTLSRFDGTALVALGYSRIIPKHIWEQVDDPLSYDGEGMLVGSGPYKMDRYDTAQGAYRYVAFDQYWGLQPAAQALEWIPVSDSVLAFEDGQIDLMNSPADLLARYRDDGQYAILTVPSLHSYRLMMNMEAAPALADVSVRQAMAYAIDRNNLIETVMRGAANLSSIGYVPMESPWFNPDIPQYVYDPQSALDLLAGRHYSFTLLTDNAAESTKTAELLKLYLEEVGITVTVESVESKTRDHAVNTGEYELLLINSGGLGGDPDYLRTTFGADADTIQGWKNEALSELLSQQIVERDEGTRKEMIDEAQQILADEVPLIMLFGAVDNYVYRPSRYDGWRYVYDSNKIEHNKLSYLMRE